MSIESVFDPYSEEILKASALPAHAGGAAADNQAAFDATAGSGGVTGSLIPFPETVIMTFSQRIIDQVAAMEGTEEIGFLLAGSKVPVYRMRIDLPPAVNTVPGAVPDSAADPDSAVEPDSVAESGAATDPASASPAIDAESASDSAPNSAPAPASTAAPPCYNIPRYVAVLRTGMGAPMAAAFMEEVIAKGGRTFIVFGSCGLLSGDLPPGSIIIPDRAFRDEGTSYHYAPAADYIKIRNAYYLAGLLKALDIPHVVGGIWTTDGLYRETVNNAKARREAGCIAVDMECSALQAVCDFRGCQLYQFVYAEDSLTDDQWDPRSMGLVPTEQLESHLQLAMMIARRVGCKA